MKYSIEDIYLLCGQYDAYCNFDFFPSSDSFAKYGSSVHGIIIYDPLERKYLESVLKLSEKPSNDGIIKLDTGNINSDNKISLLNHGFLASEISRSSIVGGIDEKVYGVKTDSKKIPFTIDVPFETEGKTEEDWLRLELLIFNHRIRDGISLLPEELLRYNTIVFILNEDDIFPEELFDKQINDVNKDALLWILTHKYKKSLRTGEIHISSEEYIKLNDLIGDRKVKRLDIIKRQLGISNKHIEEFKLTNPHNYKFLMQSILRFETESITNLGFSKPIYWDFDRYIHIFLRHYKSFFINSSTKGQGTNFQYLYKDILRLIEIVIRKNKDEIEESWRQEKDFIKYKKQGFYYNGNYYSFRINLQGKLLQFHPQE